jgi:hypothetical protein
MFGKLIAAKGQTALDYLEDELNGVVTAACDEFGHEDVDGVKAQVVAHFRSRFEQPASESRTAATHESRKPKMCPFHKDVVDISLAAQDARAGFDSMAQHWGGPRHCEGDGYEGGKCNFKPQMATQAYWDTKAEKAEERRQQRELDREQVEQETVETPEAIADQPIEEAIGEPEAFETDSAPADNVVDFPVDDAVGAPEAEEIPMSMAASTKTADEDNLGGKGTAEPKIDKRKWTPQTVPFLDDVDDPDGPNPTKRKDIVEPIKPDNSDKLEEIGEQRTEHQDVTQDHDNIVGEGGTFQGGPTTAVSSTIPQDINVNPIVELMKGEYDGFLPENVVRQAVVAHRKQ